MTKLKVQGGRMASSTGARTALAMAFALIFALAGANAARAADGDAFTDQCLLPAVSGTCLAVPNQAGTGAIAVHPNGHWVYVASKTGTARLTIFDRRDRGMLTA